MKLIKSEEILRQHLPNIIGAVKGETPLLDKLSVFLNLAEDWVTKTFTSETTFNTICKYADDNPIRQATARLVVAETMLRAIPSLDIVLTPNGFAVVSTSNLAPASKPRIDRLMGSMLTHRDNCIAALLPALPGASQWLKSDQADFFSATLFPTLAVVDAVGSTSGSKWDRYVELRSQIIDLEAQLAAEFLSTELMEKLRYNHLRHIATPEQDTVIKHTQAQIIACLKGGSFNRQRLTDIVNYIRLRPASFPEWHNSPTAQLFAPPVFHNKKKFAGYFFN